MNATAIKNAIIAVVVVSIIVPMVAIFAIMSDTPIAQAQQQRSSIVRERGNGTSILPVADRMPEYDSHLNELLGDYDGYATKHEAIFVASSIPTDAPTKLPRTAGQDASGSCGMFDALGNAVMGMFGQVTIPCSQVDANVAPASL
jgi:hypothetical protein